MKTSKVIKIIWWLAIAVAFACPLGNIIAVNTGSCIPTKSSETVWCFNLIFSPKNGQKSRVQIASC